MLQPQCEQRRHPRVRVSLPIRIWPADAGAQEPERGAAGTCTNLSLGGIRLVGREPIAPGRHLRVQLVLPDGRHVSFSGRVAWSRTTVSPEVFCSVRSPETECCLGLGFLADTPAEVFAWIRNHADAKRVHARVRALRVRRALLAGRTGPA